MSVLRSVGGVIVACMLWSMPATAAVRFVVAIGSDDGLASEEPLRWAEADAARLRDVMVDLGGVAEVRAIALAGTGVRDVERALYIVAGQVQEAKRRGDRTELVVTYSGHGSDDALHIAGAALPTATLTRLLDEVGADATVVVIDACRAPVVRAGRARGAARGPSFEVKLVDELLPMGRVIIQAASEGELAAESDDLEGAFFTHHVLAGLRGAADGNKDGQVTVAELYGYAHARTLTQSFTGTAVQHPELTTQLRGQGELVLTRLDRATAQLIIDADIAGRVLLIDARAGRVLVEVEKLAGAPLRLAVPPRRLRVLARTGGEDLTMSVAELDVTRGTTARLRRADLVAAPRLAGRARGGDQDATPWQVSSGIAALTSVALPGAWATGAVVAVERRLFELPVFVGAQLGVAQAGGPVTGAAVTDVVFSERALRLTVPVTLEAWTLVGRVAGGVALGVEAAAQDVVRSDGQRLAEGGFDVPLSSSSTSLGPVGAVRGSWLVPVWGPFAAHVVVEGGASVHTINGIVTPLPYATVSGGAAVEF